MTEDMNEETDAVEFTFILTDEWKEFFAKSEAKRRLDDDIYDSRVFILTSSSKKDGYTLGEPSMYERKTELLVGQDNFDTNASSDKPVVVELCPATSTIALNSKRRTRSDREQEGKWSSLKSPGCSNSNISLIHLIIEELSRLRSGIISAIMVCLDNSYLERWQVGSNITFFSRSYRIRCFCNLLGVRHSVDATSFNPDKQEDFLRLWKIWKNANAEILSCFYLSMWYVRLMHEDDPR
ncbi:hypothetical protein Tco_0783507 [Tanacetum coccineum]